MVENALEVSHRQVLVDGEALHLVEHRRVGRVERIGAENLAGAGHVERYTAGEHRVRLNRRGVRAHHQVSTVLGLGADATAIDVERVLHLARGVIDIKVQRVEVEPLVLDLRPLGNIPTHRHEEVRHLFHQGLKGMTCPRRATRGRQRHVDGLLDQHTSLMLSSKNGLALLKRFGQHLARLPEVLTSETALRGFQRADRTIRGHERSLITKERRTDSLQGIKRIRGFNIGEAGLANGVNGCLVKRIKVRGIASHVLLPSSFQLGSLLRASRAPTTILPVRLSSQLTGSTGALPCKT